MGNPDWSTDASSHHDLAGGHQNSQGLGHRQMPSVAAVTDPIHQGEMRPNQLEAWVGFSA